MSAAEPVISFTPVTAADLELLRGWLSAPHVTQWWGDPDTELGYIVDMIEGRDTTLPYVIHVDERPAGYIQAWFIKHHQCEPWLSREPWLAALPAEAVGIDLAIGDTDQLSRGIGSRALRLMAERLSAEGHETIIIDPDPDNRRAVAAYARAGFRPMPALIGKSGGSLIMKFEPNHSRETA
ncbi:MAG: GNAT family N-acetyltransferase [Hyphomicrobiaceae bacterium]